MLVFNQRGGRRLVRTIDSRYGTETVPPADFLIEAVDRGRKPHQAVADWWAGRPKAERASAEAAGYYTGPH